MGDEQDRDTLIPATDGDITPPPADAEFTPAVPLKDAGVSFSPEAAETGPVAAAKQALRDNGAKVRDQAGDKARSFAEQGKTRATDALGQLSGLLSDAAGQVDEKLGAQYGQYARNAAERVQAFSASIDSKSVDDIVAEARELVRKSPAAAVGAAAAIGFVVARLLSAGIDQRDA